MEYVVYGTAVGSTLKAFIKYSVVDSPLTYKITIDDFGVYNYSSTYYFDGTDNGGDLNSTLSALEQSRNMQLIGSIGLTSSQRYINAVDRGLGTAYIPISKTYNKTQLPQNIVVSCTVKIPKWERRKGNTGTTMASSTATVTATITVPAIERPIIAITGTRDSQTTVGFSVTVNSFADDVISSISIVDGSGNPLGSTTTPIRIGSSGQIVQPFVAQGVTTGSIVAKAVAIGLGGESAEESVTIPVAFFTMDVQNGGKEIAFGSSAIDSDAQGSEHGIFNCFMKAKFHNGIVSDNPLFRTATTTTASRSWSAKGTALGQYNYKPDAIEGYTPIALVGACSNSSNVSVSAYYDGSVVRGYAYNHNSSAVSTYLVLRFLYVANGLV